MRCYEPCKNTPSFSRTLDVVGLGLDVDRYTHTQQEWSDHYVCAPPMHIERGTGASEAKQGGVVGQQQSEAAMMLSWVLIKSTACHSELDSLLLA